MFDIYIEIGFKLLNRKHVIQTTGINKVMPPQQACTILLYEKTTNYANLIIDT